MLAPYVAKQKEIGVKYDGGRLGASAALFSIDKPRALRQCGRTFVAEGEQRHQGLELTVFGEPVKGLRVLGGVTCSMPSSANTGGAATDGNEVIGVPQAAGHHRRRMGRAGRARASRSTRRVIATGDSYAERHQHRCACRAGPALDIGARYVMDVGNGRLLTLRARIDNLVNNLLGVGRRLPRLRLPGAGHTAHLQPDGTLDF